MKNILNNPKFIYLWISQLLSQLTVNILNFLLLAKLFTDTGSSIATSLLWLAFALPAIFFGPIGAVLVDLVSKKKILIASNILQAIVVLGFIFVHHQSVFVLYAVVLAYSFFNQFYVPAEAASLPSIVSKKDLPQANSIFFVTQQGSLIVGFGVAGIIQKLIGFNGSLIMCSLFLFISFVSVTFLDAMNPKKKIPDTFEKVFKTFSTSMVEGYEFIKSNKNILFPLLLLLGTQIGLAIGVANLPIIAKDILKVSINLAGLYVVIPAGIGALIGSVYISKFLKNGLRKRKLIEFCLALSGLSMLVLSLGISYVSPVFVVLLGFSFIGINIPTLTYLQEKTPEWLRGRVFGNLFFLITLITVFPVLFSGAVVDLFGIKTMFVMMAVGVLFTLLYVKKLHTNNWS